VLKSMVDEGMDWIHLDHKWDKCSCGRCNELPSRIKYEDYIGQARHPFILKKYCAPLS
jgi:hypothetical protein